MSEQQRHYLFVAYDGWGLCRPLIAVACFALRLEPSLLVTLLVPSGIGDKAAGELQKRLAPQDQQRLKLVHYGEPRPAGHVPHSARTQILASLILGLQDSLPSILAGTTVQDTLTGSAVEPWPMFPAVTVMTIELNVTGRHLTGNTIYRKAEAGLGREKKGILLSWAPVSAAFLYWRNADFAPGGEMLQTAAKLVSQGTSPADAYQEAIGTSDRVIRVPRCKPVYAYEAECNHPDLRWLTAVQDGLMNRYDGGVLNEFELESDRYAGPDGILWNWPACLSKELTEARRAEAKYAFALSPFITSIEPEPEPSCTHKAEDDPVEAFLNQHHRTRGERSVVFISFGTWNYPPSEDQTRVLLTTLADLDMPYIFLPGVAPPAIRTVIERAVAASRGLGMLSHWARQSIVLRHPALCAFVTHAGSNSTVEAILAGVHMIFWPGGLDQPWIANEMVHTEGVGVELLQVRQRGHVGRPVFDGPVVTGREEDMAAEMTRVLADAKDCGPLCSTSRERTVQLRERLLRDAAHGGLSFETMKAFTLLGA